MTTFNDLFEKFRGTPEYLAEEIKIDVAKMIEELMDRAGINKSDLATAIGCSKPYVSNALKGDTNFSILSLAKFSCALNCDLKIYMKPKDNAVKASKALNLMVRKNQAKPKVDWDPNNATRYAIQPEPGIHDETFDIAA